MRRIKQFLYADSDGIILIRAKRRPQFENAPPSGTWVVREWSPKEMDFVMPCCPEVTWGTLSGLKYLGELRAEVTAS